MYTLQGGRLKLRRVSRRSGFTIVELLIVIVVIGILASITVVAFANIQQRARDSDRSSDVNTITRALELFYADNNYYPQIRGSGSTAISNEWSTSADNSWEYVAVDTPPFFSSLKSALVPKYISVLPRDPINTQNIDTRSSSTAYSYAYFGSYNSGYCGAANGQAYILVYRNEFNGVKDVLTGACGAPTLGTYGGGVSNIRVVR